MTKTARSQIKASVKWQKKNPEAMRKIRNRSGAKKYIEVATIDDLNELQQLIDARREELKEPHS